MLCVMWCVLRGAKVGGICCVVRGMFRVLCCLRRAAWFVLCVAFGVDCGLCACALCVVCRVVRSLVCL